MRVRISNKTDRASLRLARQVRLVYFRRLENHEWTDGTFEEFATRVARTRRAHAGSENRSSRRIACPAREGVSTRWQIDGSRLACHLLQSELLEPWTDQHGENTTTHRCAHRYDHSSQQKRDEELGRHCRELGEAAVAGKVR